MAFNHSNQTKLIETALKKNKTFNFKNEQKIINNQKKNYFLCVYKQKTIIAKIILRVYREELTTLENYYIIMWDSFILT